MAEEPETEREEPPPPSLWLDPGAPSRALRHAASILAVAAATAGFAILFRSAASLVFHRGFGAADVVSSIERLPHAARMAVVAVGATLAGSIGVLGARYGGSTGVGGVMEAVALGTGKISLRASLWKALGCWVAMVTGSSIGREGPIIQTGAALGGAIGLRAGMSPERQRILIAAGTAAGFAAAYNTPLAAVLFVLEIVTSVVTVDVVLATILATVVSTAITRLAVGGGPIYGQRSFVLGSDAELLLYALLGALAGVVGAAFDEALVRSEHAFTKLGRQPPASQLVGGLLVGAMAMALPEITGNGYEPINAILDGGLALQATMVLLVAKAVATSLSVGSGIPGGAFTPSLFLGAALGGTVGDLFRMAAPAHAHASGAFALVGMAALCAATTHAPLMAAVLVFELSGDYSIVVPLLIATAMATLVARRLRRTSVYMEEVERRGGGWEMTWSGRRLRNPPPVQSGDG